MLPSQTLISDGRSQLKTHFIDGTCFARPQPNQRQSRNGLPHRYCMQLIEVYRSNRRAACEQRAFVLHAVGIPSEIVSQPEGFTLWVETEAAADAQHHIERYDIENARAPTPPAVVLHEHAWIAPTLYTTVLLVAAYLSTRTTFNADWYERGALLPVERLNNEWQRSVTALTLHADQLHILGNIGFGMYFLYLAARLLGAGVAFSGALVAAAAGNALNSVLMPNLHVSIGASTMVFATLGLIAAYSWRKHFDPRLRWTHRWGPLLAGVMLLGLIGSGASTLEDGERNTDVLAHLTGFICGAALGAIFGRASTAALSNQRLQTVSAVTAVAAIAAAWWLAMVP
jgi:rhomboid protease GluP